MANQNKILQVLLIGDSGCGRSVLINSRVNKEFKNLLPTVGCDFSLIDLEVNDVKLKLQVWDVNSQEISKPLRLVRYARTDCIIICYSMCDGLRSFKNVKNYWVPEVKEVSTEVPLILVATKCDLNDRRSVEKSEGEELAKEIGAKGFFETSAKNNINVDETFECALEAILQNPLIDKRNIENPSNTNRNESNFCSIIRNCLKCKCF